MAAGLVAGREVDGVGGCFVSQERGHQHDLGHRLGAELSQGVDRRQGVRKAARGIPGDLLQLEMVGRHDIGDRQCADAHEIGDLGFHEGATLDIADHRIAAI